MRYAIPLALCLALTAPALADAPAAEAKPKINIQLDPDIAESEAAYVKTVKGLKKDEQAILKRYDKEVAAAADFQLQVAAMALKVKHCADTKSFDAARHDKIFGDFAAYRSHQLALENTARAKIQEREDQEVAFIDPDLTKAHADYLVSLMLQIGFHTMQLKYAKGGFDNTDCTEVQKTLAAVMANGNPLTATIDAAPEKVAEVQRLARSNDKSGQFLLGMLTLAGKGVAKDEAEGLRLLRKSAEQDFGRAQLVLGLALTTDMLGVAPDPAEGKYWLEKAAAQNVAGAQAALDNIKLDPKK